jgi:hypothetical protein
MTFNGIKVIMTKDLTNSSVRRQNILNNKYALSEIRKATQIECVEFNNDFYITKELVAEFFEVDTRTVNRYLKKNHEELTNNGYIILRAKSLYDFKLAAKNKFAPDIHVSTKTTQLGLFNFKAFLNIAMLLVESQRARLLRQAMLDIVLDTINARTGGGTKYINQRDEDFLVTYYQGENYRKEFTDALRDYVDLGQFKYPMYTDKIYKSIFKEDAGEYRKILKLHSKEDIRNTMYSEVLNLISSYEYGFAKVLEESYKLKKRKLTSVEVDLLFKEFESQALWKPLLENARNKMASRDLCFRDALHHQLEGYITPLDAADFERFLGEKSKELAKRLEEAKDVMKRLKERE